MTQPSINIGEIARPMKPEDMQEKDDAEAADNSQQDGVYVFPASEEQNRYWILDQLGGASTASNMAIAFRLEGPVVDSIVDECIHSLTLRHEALRTTFQMIDGNLSQVIAEDVAYSFEVCDLRELPEDRRLEQAEALILEHSHVRIDLAKGPLFYVRLIHLTDAKHFLAFTVHHITCDGWSNGILIRDFADLYAAAIEHREPGLPELPFQYADFTVWQDEWLNSSAAEEALDFWKEHIQRDLPPIDLPTDFPRTAQKSFPGNIEGHLLPQELNARLTAYCKQHDSTKHQVLLAVLEVLVTRYTGQKEFLLGSTIANRTQPGMENVIGRFAHPQVILADVKGNPSFREMVGRIADWTAKSYAHQDLPFSKLAEAFQLDQAGGGTQFLQVYFVYQKAFMQPQRAGELSIIPRPSVSGGVNFDMLVSIVERNEGPRLQIEYNTTLFRRERIRGILDQFVRVLEAVLADDTLTVSQLPLLSLEEQSKAVSTASAQSSTVIGLSLPEQFDLHANALGDAVAIVTPEESITWKALQAKSLHFAAAMRVLGIESGQTIAIRMEATADASAAVLAAWRRGAVVLPVPVSASHAEWEHVFIKARPSLTLASSGAGERALSFTALERLIDAPHEELAVPAADLAAWMGPQHADDSYNFVTVSHAATLESHLSAAQALGLMPGDAVLALPSTSAVEALTDMLLPLLAGATIVHSNESEPAQLQSALNEHQISYAIGTPAEWSASLKRGWLGDRRTQLICRGGRISPSFAAALTNSRSHVWSLLSSAVTAGPFSIARLHAGSESLSPLVPLAGETISLEDPSGLPVPFAIPGEVVIHRGEAALRPGYLATYSPQPGFEVVEQSHRLVRLQNYRIKLGELEDLLLRQPSVAQAEAVLRSDAEGKPTLVAYITGHNSLKPDVSTISAWLRAEAPQHLASAELVPVNAISCRIDGSPELDALPLPGSSASFASSVSEDYVPPRDELETRLVAIWEQVIGIQGIGIRTNFFSLGGYSLTIVRLFANINRTLSLSLPITTIFNAPTIEQLADIIRGRTLYSPLVPVQPKGSKPPFFMIHSYLLYGGLPKVLGEDYPFYGLRELDGSEVMTLEERAASYVREIRSVQPKGPYYLGGWCAAGPLTMETARQLKQANEEVGIVVLFDAWRPGYVAEVMEQQKGNPEMALRAVLTRKYRYHSARMASFSTRGKMQYLRMAGAHKLRSTRDKLYRKNWKLVHNIYNTFGMPLPDFMQNISRNTLETKQATEPIPVPLSLIRATESTYIPGAEPACGWSTMTTGRIDIEWAPGDHESMFMEPNLGKVGDLLRNSLEKAYAEQSDAESTNVIQ